MAKGRGDAAKNLTKSLEKFKELYKGKGWEDEELHQKITESYEEFPWYRYNDSKKWTLRSILWNGILAALILYLFVGAVLTHNRRLNKRVNDAYFDARVNYQYLRYFRYLTLPLHQLLDISSYHRQECVLNNPMFVPEPMDCSFCEGIDSIESYRYDHPNLTDVIADQEPVHVTNVPEYVESPFGWEEIKNLYKKFEDDMDRGSCEIADTSLFKKVSDYFKLSEAEAKERQLSISWKNCAAESTRFYRHLFKKPAYIDRSAEIYIEKWIYILHPNTTKSVKGPDGMSGHHSFIAQISGESTFSMGTPKDCHYNCTETPFSTKVNRGDVVNFPVSNWDVTIEPTGDDWCIIYISTWQ